MAVFAEGWGRSRTSFSHRSFRADPRRKSSRGVADVIGTILLLGITVTLFGAVFFFVNAFPTPPPQPTGQFSASVTYSTNGKLITVVSIVHLAGPLLQGNTQIWLGSQSHPAKFPSFETLSLGLKGSSQWAIGQTWVDNVTSLGLTTPDNITVNIIANNQLVFHTVVPGSAFTTAPQFVQAGTVPSPVPVNGAFELFVQINDANLNTNSVFANLSQLPGAPGIAFEKLNYTPSTGVYECIVRGAWTNTPGTFYAFVNSTDKGGLTNSIAVPVQIGGGGSGGGSGGQLVLQLGINNSAPVLNQPIRLVASLTNFGSSSGSGVVNWSVPAGGNPATLPQSPISVAAGGSTAVLSNSWTPTSTSDIGPHAFTARASVGFTTVTATLNVTIFPRILFISQNLPALPAPLTSTNGSAYLANALQAAGFPFTTLVVPCTASLTAAQMSGYGVVIINFGTNTTSTCIAAGLGSNELPALTAAYTAGSSIWVVGANFWSLNPCAKTGWSTFATDFGLSNSASCASLVTTLPATPTATFTNVGALLKNGTNGPSYPVTATINGFSNFNAYGKLTTILGTAGTYLTLSSGDKIGLAQSGAERTAILTLDPMMLVDGSAGGGPASTGIGAAGSEVVYNVVNYLAGLSSAANGGSTGRVTVDFAVSEVLVVGTVHGSPTTVWAGIRSNAATAAIVSVALYVNGAPALQNGVPVTATLIIPKTAGYTTFVSLPWQAPSAGGFTISVLVIGAGDLVSWNNGLPASLLSTPTTFS